MRARMPLPAGTKLGRYEIESPLGAGGMGEVYRARDTRLDRTVALKVLPTETQISGEQKARFEREARAISSLQHPHICTLYDVGDENGVEFLVMEYLQGQTLEERLRKGPLLATEVAKIGIEIAGALDKAHRRGIIHRDLKPGNVMLTGSGAKLMDFGLAKPLTMAVAAESEATLVGVTAQRTILGTPGYMAPEQVRGEHADARSDIFALGAVLYEATTGTRPFTGASDIGVLNATLEAQPAPILELQPASPPSLQLAIQTCIAKDPDERWQSAYDLLVVLRGIEQAPRLGSGKKNRRTAALLASAVFVLAALGATILMLHPRERPELPVRLQVAQPALFFIEQFQSVSPNSRYLAFTAFGSEHDAAPQPPMLWVRPLGASDLTPLKETVGASHHFWSPDSRYIGYFANGALKKVPVTGGPPQTICDAPGAATGTWSTDGNVLYAVSQNTRTALFRVPASGGVPERLKVSDEHGRELETANWPSFLPDGQHFLFRTDTGGIYVASINTGSARHVVDAGSMAEYAAGYLLYVREGSLVAHRFDPKQLRTQGGPVPIAAGVRHNPAVGSAHFSVSSVVLSYLAGPNRLRLVLRDRNGTVRKEIGSGDGGAVAVSRDGRRVAAAVLDSATNKPDIWVYDLERNTGFRFLSASGVNMGPVWSPDGKELIYSSVSDGHETPHLFRQKLDESRAQVVLPADGRVQRATDWSSDGTKVLYTEEVPGCFTCATLGTTWILSLRDGKKVPLMLNSVTGAAQFSPNGKWVAFSQLDGNEIAIYVIPTNGGERQRVSVGGGILPRWRRDGRELFYQSMDSFDYMSVPVGPGPKLRFGKATPLFARDPLDFADFDVLPDGKGLVTRVALPGGQESPPATVVLNWASILSSE